MAYSGSGARVAYSGSGAAPPAAHPFQLLTLSATPAGAETERSDAAAVGTWGMEALILTLPGLKPLFKETLPTDVIPRRWGGCTVRWAAALHAGGVLALCGWMLLHARIPAQHIPSRQHLHTRLPHPASLQHTVCPV